jgi:hypothetical protein
MTLQAGSKALRPVLLRVIPSLLLLAAAAEAVPLGTVGRFTPAPQAHFLPADWL